MAAGDLTTLANVEGWLGLAPGNEDEALLGRLITAASGFIQTWCGRQFASQAWTETRDGHGGTRMAFLNTPVTAVTGLVVSGEAIPAGDAWQTPGFYFSPTMLYLNGHRFRRGAGNVAIATTAGYATTPLEVEQACIELVGFKYRALDRIGLASKSLAGETTSFVLADLPAEVAAALALYRRVSPTWP